MPIPQPQRSPRPLALWFALAMLVAGAALMLASGDRSQAQRRADERLVIAICNCKADAIDAAIARGAAVNPPIDAGRWICPPLQQAVIQGHPAAVRLLLERGANINARGSSGLTPLMCVIDVPNKNEIATILLEAGADPSMTDPDGHTVLDLAHQEEDVDLVELLSSIGAGPQAK